MSTYPYIPAKPISYGGQRALTAVQYIVIHYTGNDGDTARNNCNFFAHGNTRSAGAHFFVSQNGDAYQSIELKRIAYAVGGFVTQSNGAGSYYKKCTNTNSVSIELCDNASKDPSAAQTKAVRELIIFIRKFCPNAKTIIRHWDVSGKSCPARMTGTGNAKWTAFRTAIGSGKAAEVQSVDPVQAEPKSAALAVDGIVGFQTTKVWQRVMGTEADGIISGQSNSLKKYHAAIRSIHYGSGGSTLIRAVQRTCGVSVDGLLGPKTIKAIQSRLGCTVDGYFGSETARALQTRLNVEYF